MNYYKVIILITITISLMSSSKETVELNSRSISPQRTKHIEQCKKGYKWACVLLPGEPDFSTRPKNDRIYNKNRELNEFEMEIGKARPVDRFEFTFNGTHYTVLKNLLIYKNRNKKDILISTKAQYFLDSRISINFTQINNKLLLRVGKSTFEGTFYILYFIDPNKTNEFWAFNRLCANWDDLLFNKEGRLFYWCEFTCNKRKKITLIDAQNNRYEKKAFNGPCKLNELLSEKDIKKIHFKRAQCFYEKYLQ